MRRPNDFYPTPAWATETLLRYVEIRGSVLECCAGDNAITSALHCPNASRLLWTNDIDLKRYHPSHFDAADKYGWMDFRREHGDMEWVVTNPPFNAAPEIVPCAYSFASVGIAMLLRISYLEPVENRGAWLNAHPPTMLIVLPRISFTGNGKTDNVTCAWFVWDKRATGQQIIVAENPKFTAKQERMIA